MARPLVSVLSACVALLAAVLAWTAALAASPPEFRLGFKSLAEQIPSIVGAPLEDEHHNPLNGDGLQNPLNGDGLQQTARGLMVWRKADNWTAFTNGYWTWVNGPYGLQSRSNEQRFTWEAATPTPAASATPTPTATPSTMSMSAQPLQPARVTSLNGGFLLLNMHGALFHSDLYDFRENAAYARWMGSGVIRVFATDNNGLKQWDGARVGQRIADAAPYLRERNVKLLVALVNNHRPVPGEAASSFGWLEGYEQLLLPFYTQNWRGAYLQFVQALISTVRARGALDVIYGWEIGNEIHTPQQPVAIMPFISGVSQEIRRLDPTTPILPGIMGVNHLDPWNVQSGVARWIYCDVPIDAYTLHAYDWSSKEQWGDMPIQWDLDYTTAQPCESGRKLPVIVEELGTSRSLPGVYTADQELKRLEQEKKQLRYVLGYPQVKGVGVWTAESPTVTDRMYYDNRRGLTSYGPNNAGDGSAYDPRFLTGSGVRAMLEQVLRALPKVP